MRNVIAERKWWAAASALILAVALAAVAAPVAPKSQEPPLVPWTAVLSTFSPDEDTLPIFSFTGPWFSYLPGNNSLNRLTARHNVESPSRFEPKPGWAQLELTSHVPAAGSFASATLFRVDPCTGQQEEICTTTNSGSEHPICTTCDFVPEEIDFSHHLYYVRVVLSRADQPNPPRAAAVRLTQ